MIREFPTKHRGRRTVLVVVAAIILILLFSISAVANFLTNIKWFESVKYISIFWTTFKAKILLWLIAFAIGLAITLLNHFFGLGKSVKNSDLEPDMKSVVFWVGLVAAVVLPLFLASSFQSGYWEEYLKAINSTSIGVSDPIFNNDIGYYMMVRPFSIGIVRTLLTFFIIITAVNGIFYFTTGIISQNHRSRVHIGILVAIVFLLLAYLHKFKVEGIVFSTRGRVFGAGFTDVHVTLPYYKILIGILVVSAILTLFFTIKKKFSKWAFSGIALYLAVVIVGAIVSSLVQSFVVSPNEIAKESEYIDYNIKYTRQGFGLDEIDVKSFEDKDTFSPELVERNAATIDNIRINDYQASLVTYNQLQGIRQYYTFNGMDIDRYMINDKLTQVFISARELDKTKVNNTHVNMLYKFTHGMGVGLNAVNEVTQEGQPNFLIKDIPPKSKVDIDIEQPRIYYGELTNDSVIVNANNIKEFDYPAGETNVETVYEGTGGVALSGINRLLFSLREGSLKMLVSNYIDNNSKIMIYRNINQRIRTVAPFLLYDTDPYITIVDGKLKWIVDAYTVSDKYPYSEPIEFKGRYVNYVRNPVKVVVDAYNGDIDFYVIDEEEPFIKVYGKIYPDLFKSADEMPDSLKEHIRYPEDLFNIQTVRYLKYHMSDTTVFYNEEDLWQIATEKYSGDIREVRPYYVLMKLPENESEEFILMRPFTPINKNNAIAWMAARNDGENYGELQVYKFPKGKLVYGPSQIESKIDQTPTISNQLTLWDQRGSNVIRGNILMIPIEDTILYVEPLYIKSDANNALPEMKKVIVAYKDRVVMTDTLYQGIEKLFTKVGIDDDITNEEELTMEELIEKAVEYLEQSKSSSGSGDWTEFGQNLDQLEDILNQLKDME